MRRKLLGICVIVRFAIQKDRATFNGARTLSVTTDAAGRATGTTVVSSSGDF